MIEVTGTLGSASFSECRTFRYTLSRHTGYLELEKPGFVLFLLTNPSKAAHDMSDPTDGRCKQRTLSLGYSRYAIANAFALRSTDPKLLYKVDDPIGPENDEAIMSLARDAALVICGWGKHGKLRDRGATVLKMLRDAGITPYALKINKDGSPAHPLYIPYKAQPVEIPA